MGRGSYKEGSGIGTYPVTLPESAKFEYTMLEKAIHRRYVIERVQIRIEGEITRDDRGVWLTTGGGSRLLLKNRPKKDDKDTPPDVLAKVVEALKAGRTFWRVEGDATVSKDATVVRLESAEAVEKKKP